MDVNKLTADRVTLNQEQVEIPGVGTITVRGLSRYEILLAEKVHPDDMLARERFVMALAMIDPPMTEAQVGAWQKASGPTEINDVNVVVNRLSGIGKGAEKSGLPRTGERPGDVVRPLPGPEAVDDDRPVAPGDDRG